MLYIVWVTFRSSAVSLIPSFSLKSMERISVASAFAFSPIASRSSMALSPKSWIAASGSASDGDGDATPRGETEHARGEIFDRGDCIKNDEELRKTFRSK